MRSLHLIVQALTEAAGVARGNRRRRRRFLCICWFLLVLGGSAVWCQQESEERRQETGSANQLTGQAELQPDSSKALSETAKKTTSAKDQAGDTSHANAPKALAAKDSVAAAPFLVIGFAPHIVYENVAVVEIGLDEYLSVKLQKWGDNVTGSGIAVGFLLPVRLSFLMAYYHAKATIHWAMPKDSSIVQTFLTGTNELRIGAPLIIYNVPFEYVPMIGLGLNNCAIGYFSSQGKIRGGGMEYYLFYSVGLTIRQPFHVSKRFYSMGLSMDFERALTCDDGTKQRLVFALLLGL
jgi:hypothetical protein